MTTPRTRRTKSEIAAAANLDAREKLANKVLADPESSANKRTNAERDLRGIDRQRKELAERIEDRARGRKPEDSNVHLLAAQAKFPPIVFGASIDWGKKLFGESAGSVGKEPEATHLSIPELEEHLSKVNAHLSGLGIEEHFKSARQYLREQSEVLRDEIRNLKADAAAELRLAEAEQANREFLAAEEVVRPLRENFEARLSKGFLPLKIREQSRLRFVELAADARHQWRIAIGVESKTPVPLTQIRPSAIFKAKTEFLEEAARRLELFEWDLNSEPELHTLDPFYWNTGLILSAPYFAFRSPNEKVLIAYVARKYYRSKNDISNLGRIPDLPNPIVVPAKPTMPLEVIRELEMKRCLEALEPVHFDLINEQIYTVETNSLQHPHSKPLLLWPDGREVQVNKEVLWDRKAGGYRRMPEPMALEPKWSVGPQRYEWEQDERGDWKKVPVSNDAQESWTQNEKGEFVRDTSLPSGEWKLQPLLRVVKGDHKPALDDARQYFRSGHWFNLSDIERADQVSLNMNSRPTTGARVVPDQIARKRDDSTSMSDEEKSWTWRIREAEINSELNKRNS
jgi:hypothetical protein